MQGITGITEHTRTQTEARTTNEGYDEEEAKKKKNKIKTQQINDRTNNEHETKQENRQANLLNNVTRHQRKATCNKQH
jgi:hypothetical protein